MFTLLGELGVTPVSVLEAPGCQRWWAQAPLAEGSRSLDGEWEDESLFCSFGPSLELGGAFGSAQLQIEEEILPWVCSLLTSTEALMGLLGLK